MREWDENFSQKRNVNGKIITIGQQDFENSTIEIMEENGKIIDCPMGIDRDGDIFFLYEDVAVYVREYVYK